MQPCLRACLMAALVASTAVASPVPKSQSSEDNAPPIRNEADLQPRADSNDLGPLNINAPLPGAPLLEDNAPPTTDKSASCTHTDVDGCLDIDFDKLPKGVAAILGAEGLPPMPWDLHVKNKSNRPLTTEPKTEGAPINAASLPPIPVDIGPDNKDTWTVSKESKTEVAGPMNQAAFPIIPVIGPDNKDTWTVNKEPKTELVAPMNEVALPPIPIDIGPDNKNTWNLIKEPMTTGYGWNEEHRPIGPLDNFTTTTMLNGGYWPAWQGAPDFSDDKCLPMESLTHINFAFAGIGQDGSLQLKNVPTLLAWTQQKENNPNLKVILSVGGGSGPKKFQTMTSTSALMRKFAETTAATVHKYGLDGIDIDWEFPEANEGQRFLALMTALREVLPSPLQISAALPTGDWVMSHLPMAELAEQIDFLNLMAYDLVDASYQGVSLTGHQANPLCCAWKCELEQWSKQCPVYTGSGISCQQDCTWNPSLWQELCQHRRTKCTFPRRGSKQRDGSEVTTPCRSGGALRQ